jgi:hypothetical protein
MRYPAALLVAALLPWLSACAVPQGQDTAADMAYERLPDEIAGFRKSRPAPVAPEAAGPPQGEIIAQYLHPSQARVGIITLTAHPGAPDGETGPEVEAVLEGMSRAAMVVVAARGESGTARRFDARESRTGLGVRCVDVQVLAQQPRRDLGCARLMDGRVVLVLIAAPDVPINKRDIREPLVALTLRLLISLAGAVPGGNAPSADPLPSGPSENLPLQERLLPRGRGPVLRT